MTIHSKVTKTMISDVLHIFNMAYISWISKMHYRPSTKGKWKQFLFLEQESVTS